jgi:hypothetical protein
MRALGRKEDADGGGEEVALGRRALVVGLMATAVAGRAEAAPCPHRQVELAAQDLAAAMQRLHGGKWNVRVAHELGYVAVARASSGV